MPTAIDAALAREDKLEIKASGDNAYVQIPGVTNLSKTTNNEVQTWYTYDDAYSNSSITGKGMEISVEGVVYKDNAAQKKLLDLEVEVGSDANIDFQYTDGAMGIVYTGTAAVEITSQGGAPTDNKTFSAVLHVKGKPSASAVSGNG
jgi:hypothetical protein